MSKLTEHQRALLQAAMDGKTLQRRLKMTDNSSFEDADNLILFFNTDFEWRIKPNSVEALAKIAWEAYIRADDNNWHEVIRALAEKCPELLKVKL